MHLDCVFSVLGKDLVLMLEEIMGEDSPTRRLVDEYVRGPDGKYKLARYGKGELVSLFSFNGTILVIFDS
jgi:arginine deiminase